jgi:hypothetical protein
MALKQPGVLQSDPTLVCGLVRKDVGDRSIPRCAENALGPPIADDRCWDDYIRVKEAMLRIRLARLGLAVALRDLCSCGHDMLCKTWNRGGVDAKVRP